MNNKKKKIVIKQSFIFLLLFKKQEIRIAIKHVNVFLVFKK